MFLSFTASMVVKPMRMRYHADFGCSGYNHVGSVVKYLNTQVAYTISEINGNFS